MEEADEEADDDDGAEHRQRNDQRLEVYWAIEWINKEFNKRRGTWHQ